MTGVASRLKELLARAAAGPKPDRDALFLGVAEIVLEAPEGLAARERDMLEAMAAALAGAAGADARRLAAEKAAAASPPPQRLMQALIDDGGEDALLVLARNRNAALTPKSLIRLVERSRAAPDLQEALARRFDLPPPALTRLYFIAPAALKRALLKRAEMLDPDLVAKAVDANRTRVKAVIGEFAESWGSEPHAFLRSRIDAGEAPARLLVEMMAPHRRDALALAFAYAAGVGARTSRRILGDRFSEALALACRMTDVDPQSFARLLDAVSGDGADEKARQRIIDLYERIPAEAAERIMRCWRMNSVGRSDSEREQARTLPARGLSEIALRAVSRT